MAVQYSQQSRWMMHGSWCEECYRDALGLRDLMNAFSCDATATEGEMLRGDELDVCDGKTTDTRTVQ